MSLLSGIAKTVSLEIQTFELEVIKSLEDIPFLS